jgi:hypothetical protein
MKRMYFLIDFSLSEFPLFNEFLLFQIIEHLIPLSELLDLGFDESTISDALIKFNNNKDKALDYLIS